jgi:hypothetical protein
MRKSVYVLAILAAALSTAAVAAEDLKQDKKATAPAVSATQMSDSEMDKVTAGAGAGAGVDGALLHGGNPNLCPACDTHNYAQPTPGSPPGFGLGTAGRL